MKIIMKIIRKIIRKIIMKMIVDLNDDYHNASTTKNNKTITNFQG